MLHRTRRSLILVVAILGLLAGLAAPVSAADPAVRGGGTPLPSRGPARATALNVPAGVLGFRSYRGWVYADDSIAIVGEVLNNNQTRRKAIGITVTYYETNTSSTPLGTHSDEVIIDGVSRGGLGPFVVFDPTPPAGTGAFLVEITSSAPATAAPVGGLDIVSEASFLDPSDGSIRHFPGSVRNPNAFAVENVSVALTAYAGSSADSVAGDVLDVLDPISIGSIPAGGTVDFDFPMTDDYTFGTDPDVVHIPRQGVSILADGYRAGQSTAYVTSWANYFDDLFGNTFRPAIIWLAEQDITRGCGPGRYCPDADVTRGQMAAFLDRALDLPDTTTDFFTDDETSTFENAINRLAASGITKGCTATRFCPKADVSRGQMAAFLQRALTD